MAQKRKESDPLGLTGSGFDALRKLVSFDTYGKKKAAPAPKSMSVKDASSMYGNELTNRAAPPAKKSAAKPAAKPAAKKALGGHRGN